MAEVEVRRVGRAGVVTLNRPRALNALNHEMILAITAAIERFSNDSSCELILLGSSTAKAFCSGGDLRRIRECVLAGDLAEPHRFFRDEYRLNRTIAELKTPFISLIDGICMGGGAGLSIHGRYRIFSERASFSMPETAIGFFPDVGASFFLPRIGMGVGLWLALTSSRISGADAVSVGLGTHYVEASRLPALSDRLCFGCHSVEAILKETASEATDNIDVRALNELFDCATLGHVLFKLKHCDTDLARRCLAEIERMCPRSLSVAFELIRLGQSEGLEACQSREFEMATQLIVEADFLEGVASVLLEKRKPVWKSRFEKHQTKDDIYPL